jgi:rod shape-determining protein MreD
MAKSILVSSFILFCAVLTEASVLANISFLYSMPDLVLICTVYFALLNGRGVGQTTGFISGILLDFITGIPFGFNRLYLWIFYRNINS